MAYVSSVNLYWLERLGYSTTEASSTYLYDALGSVRQVMTASGLMLTKSYDPPKNGGRPYGNLIYSNGTETAYGFTGEPQDTSTGLVYLRARTYNPFTGTFTSRDTWDGDANLPMSYNRWLYANGNPVNYTDPSGHRIDDNGIGYVNKYKDDFDNINYPYHLDAVTIASAIAVQSQYLNGIDNKGQKLAYDLLCLVTDDYQIISKLLLSPGLGYGQISVYDETIRQFTIEHPDNQKTPVDIPQFGDPYIMTNSINAMVQRIINKVGTKCLNHCLSKDRLVIIAMAQNGGFSFEDLGGLGVDENGNPVKDIDWGLFFSKQKSLVELNGNRGLNIANDIRAGKYINYNTRYQLKLFIDDMNELATKYDWDLPYSTSQSVINEIKYIAENGTEMRR